MINHSIVIYVSSIQTILVVQNVNLIIDSLILFRNDSNQQAALLHLSILITWILTGITKVFFSDLPAVSVDNHPDFSIKHEWPIHKTTFCYKSIYLDFHFAALLDVRILIILFWFVLLKCKNRDWYVCAFSEIPNEIAIFYTVRADVFSPHESLFYWCIALIILIAIMPLCNC